MIMLKQHPLSAIFPSLPDDELKALATDIKAHGLYSAITLYKGEVLDGWHRYLACTMACVNPRTMEYKGNDPKAFVKSANWHRRHLSASQRGLAEVQLSEWAPIGKPGLIPSKEGIKTAAEMATDAGVGIATIERAKTVYLKGSDTLKEAVKEGHISIGKAFEVAKLPKAKQAKAMVEQKQRLGKPEKSVNEWQAKYDTLVADYNELRENRDELADELKTCEAIRTGETALEIQKIRFELKTCTRRRDELMASAVEMRKSLAWWQKEAKKLGWKPKAA